MGQPTKEECNSEPVKYLRTWLNKYSQKKERKKNSKKLKADKRLEDNIIYIHMRK